MRDGAARIFYVTLSMIPSRGTREALISASEKSSTAAMGQHFGTGTFSYRVLKVGEESVTMPAHSHSRNIS